MCFRIAIVLLMLVPAAAMADDPVRLTVMSFNVRYGTADDGSNAWPKRRDLVVQMLREYEPDVIGVQECLLFQAEYIAEELKGYRWIGLGRQENGTGEMSAILYNTRRLVPVESGHFWISKTPEVPGSSAWFSSLPRMVTWARFYDWRNDRSFHHFNTHFDHVSGRARAEGAKLLAERATAFDEGYPVVVTGDFNALAEESDPWQNAIDGGLKDAWTEAEKQAGPETTWSGFEAPDPDDQRRIDWVLYRGGLLPLTCETVIYNQEGQYPSDHFPVVAEFVLEAPADAG